MNVKLTIELNKSVWTNREAKLKDGEKNYNIRVGYDVMDGAVVVSKSEVMVLIKPVTQSFNYIYLTKLEDGSYNFRASNKACNSNGTEKLNGELIVDEVWV